MDKVVWRCHVCGNQNLTELKDFDYEVGAMITDAVCDECSEKVELTVALMPVVTRLDIK